MPLGQQRLTDWRLAPGLRTKVWDGEMVVYDRATGDTHCLDRVLTAAAAALSALGKAATPALAAALEAQLGPAPDPDFDRAGTALAELERLKLAERC